MGLASNLNTYTYAAQNVVINTDSEGLKIDCLPGMRCSGDADLPPTDRNPPKKPRGRRWLDPSHCKESNTTYNACIGCCSKLANTLKNPWWQGACNADCVDLAKRNRKGNEQVGGLLPGGAGVPSEPNRSLPEANEKCPTDHGYPFPGWSSPSTNCYWDYTQVPPVARCPI